MVLRLNKREFIYALCLSYNLGLSDVPNTCSCGTPNSTNHSLPFKLGGYPYMRHYSVKWTIAKFLREFCKYVQIKQSLLPVNGKVLPSGANIRYGATAVISAVGLWQCLEKAFIDIQVFKQNA